MKEAYTTGQLAKITGWSQQGISNLADRGLIPHRRNALGYREFPIEAIAAVFALKKWNRNRTNLKKVQA